MAGGSTANQRNAAVKICHFTGNPGSAKRAERPGVGVNDRDADRRAGNQAHFTGGTLGEAVAERFAHHFDVAADLGGIVLQHVFQSNLFEIAFVPALFMAEIGPFAHRRTQ
ncbi:hypothetical protein D3C71_1698730 [compost metagenome]